MNSIFIAPRGLGQPLAGAPSARAVADSSFDDDIPWVLESFMVRMLSDGALLASCGVNAGSRVVMAVGSLAGAPLAVGEQLARLARLAVQTQPGRLDLREPLLAWSTYDTAETCRALLIPLPAEGRRRLVLVVAYSTGSSVTAEDAEALAGRLYPVMKGYFRLWARLDAERLRTHALEAALDAQGVGIGVLDRNGAVLFLNDTLGRMVDEENGLRRHGETIVATDLASAVRLQVAVAQALGATGGSYVARQAAPLVSIKRPGGGRPLLAVVMPATADTAEPGAVAAVMNLLDPDADCAPALKPVCALHGLSPVETVLVSHLIQGNTVCDAAAKMRIKGATARAYLKQVFLKTDTNRQADLIRLMLSSLCRLHQDICPVAV